MTPDHTAPVNDAPRPTTTDGPPLIYREQLGQFTCQTPGCFGPHDKVYMFCPDCRLRGSRRPLTVQIDAKRGVVAGECLLCGYVSELFVVATAPQ